MAWRNLQEFIKITLDGSIPLEAPCRIIAGNGKKKKSRYKNGLKVLVKSARKLLKKAHGTRTTVGEFVAHFGMFATETEWTLTADGKLIHYRGPYRKKKRFVWYTIVQLDLNEWLAEQPDDVLALIARQAFEWRCDGEDYVSEFYKNLDRLPRACG